MNWFDFVLIAPIIACGIFGIKIGLIRAAFGALGVILGILIAGRVSDDLGGLYAGLISNETLANVIAYGLIILISLIAARVLTIVVTGIIKFLLMGWVDKVAGLAVGLVAGAALSGAVITGLADLTYDSDLIARGVASGSLENKVDVAEVKERLEKTLIDSALVGLFIDVTGDLPANALGFVPPNLMAALEVLEKRMDG